MCAAETSFTVASLARVNGNSTTECRATISQRLLTAKSIRSFVGLVGSQARRVVPCS